MGTACWEWEILGKKLNHIIEHVSGFKNVSTECIWVSYFQMAMAHHSVLKGARVMLMGLKSCSLTPKCWKPPSMSLQRHLRPLMTINDPYINTMLNQIVEHVSGSKNVSTECIWVSYFQMAVAHHSVLKGARIMLMGLKSCSLTPKCWKPPSMSL